MDNLLADKQLIDGCLAEDPFAREQFVRRFSRLVYGTILGAVKTRGAHAGEEDIADLHNTVFVSFFERRCRKLRQYEGRNGCSLASWVRMVTVRAALDFLRRRKDALARTEQLAPLELARELIDEQASPLECLQAVERTALIQKGLARLADRDRLMIQLHCLEERPLAQVALILDVSLSNIHSLKHRAVQRLKEAVAEMIQTPTGPARKKRGRRPLD